MPRWHHSVSDCGHVIEQFYAKPFCEYYFYCSYGSTNILDVQLSYTYIISILKFNKVVCDHYNFIHVGTLAKTIDIMHVLFNMTGQSDNS